MSYIKPSDCKEMFLQENGFSSFDLGVELNFLEAALKYSAR